jgi:glycosyltransferase involved in cell wall biosynthesis
MNGINATNILFVHNNNDLYGADTFLLEILKRLDRTRFRPLVVLPADVRHINRLSVELEKNRIEYRFIRLGVMRRKYFTPIKIVRFFVELLVGITTLVWMIRRRNVAIVHSNTITVTAGAFAAFLTGTPHVWHIHEILVDPVPLRRGLHWLVPRFATVVLCVSNAVRNHIAADQPSQAHKLRVIHVGIEAERFAKNVDGSRVRMEFGISPEAPLIGMVGKVCRWKGQLVFAAAARRVLECFPRARFLAVGGVFDDERHYMERFRSEVESLGIAHAFHIGDFRLDIPGVMDAFDVFVLPSTRPDPCPAVVLEAMAASKPVIATAHGGPVEILLDGETGHLVPPADPEGLAEGICRLLRNPGAMECMGEAGRRRVWQQFHIRRFMAEIESLYAELSKPNLAVPRTESELEAKAQLRE